METTTLTRIKPKKKFKKPSLYRVVMLNDDFTPMEFVVIILQDFFGKSTAEAAELTMEIHNHGLAVVGVYSYEIAETKASQVVQFAQQSQHPLQCKVEKE